VLLIDYVDPSTGAPDGKVDAHYRLDNLSGDWPLGERWEGSVVLDEYVSIPQGGPPNLGVTTPNGLVQLFAYYSSAGVQAQFQDPRAAAVLTFQTSSVGSVPPGSFDQLEKLYVAQAVEQADRRAKGLPAGPSSAATSPSALIPSLPRPTTPSGEPAVRVGGSISTPRKIVDVRPVYPPEAQAARVQGVVILEAVIATDGSVTSAKVLRSIPLLDQAALDCVRQWKFEPTQLNGAPVPVIMTVTVNFTLQTP
jgi:TonB family protein